MKRLALPALLLIPSVMFGQSYTVTSEKDATNVVLRLKGGSGWWQISGANGNHYGQKSDDSVMVIVPSLKAGVPRTVEFPKMQEAVLGIPFEFAETAGQSIDIKKGTKLYTRFMNGKRDGSTKDQHELTFKPFHHVFDPEKGETLLTNGAGLAANKELLYPHHRGLFYAFNKVSYGDQKCDVWHGKNGEYVEFDQKIMSENGPTMARHRSRLSWHGTKGDIFAHEERMISVYETKGGTMIDFESILMTTLDKVQLDGDPQHAGFHFRAAMEVSKNGKENTYYLRPDGKGKVGETRNWDPKTKDPKTINLPWDACSFVVKEKRYTLLRVPHTDNPKETRGSERDYGRFGDYFEWTLTPTTPLKVKYRVWVQAGEMTVEQCQSIANGFTVKTTVKEN